MVEKLKPHIEDSDSIGRECLVLGLVVVLGFGFVQHNPAVDYSSTAGLFVLRSFFFFLFSFF
jgi:hypothetical protein